MLDMRSNFKMPDDGPAIPRILFGHLLAVVRVNHGRNFGPMGYMKPNPGIIKIMSNIPMTNRKLIKNQPKQIPKQMDIPVGIKQ